MAKPSKGTPKDLRLKDNKTASSKPKPKKPKKKSGGSYG